LRMSGATPLLPLCAFMACTGQHDLSYWRKQPIWASACRDGGNSLKAANTKFPGQDLKSGEYTVGVLTTYCVILCHENTRKWQDFILKIGHKAS
jgi:hypothetical protein